MPRGSSHYYSRPSRPQERFATLNAFDNPAGLGAEIERRVLFFAQKRPLASSSLDLFALFVELFAFFELYRRLIKGGASGLSEQPFRVVPGDVAFSLP